MQMRGKNSWIIWATKRDYIDLGIPNLIRKMVMVKWIIGSFFSII